jgi:hypothetical protein
MEKNPTPSNSATSPDCEICSSLLASNLRKQRFVSSLAAAMTGRLRSDDHREGLNLCGRERGEICVGGSGRNRGLTNNAASSDHEIRLSSFASNTQNMCAISSSAVAIGARTVDPLRTPTTAAWCCTKRQGENQIRIRQIEYHSITQTLTKKADQIGARKSEQGVSHLMLEWPPTPPSRRSPARAPVSPACHRRPAPSSRWHSAVGRRWEVLGGTKPWRRGTARRVQRRWAGTDGELGVEVRE